MQNITEGTSVITAGWKCDCGQSAESGGWKSARLHLSEAHPRNSPVLAVRIAK